MDWRLVYFGHVDRAEVMKYVVDPEWQKFRLDMKGKSIEYKYATLCWWLKHNDSNRMSQVQCTNYVTALSRGGLIKVDEYR